MGTSLEVAGELRKQFEKRRNDPKTMWGIPWAFQKLNTVTGGIQWGEISVLIAASSAGKSSLAGLIAQTAAQWVLDTGRSDKWEVRVVTLEMLQGNFLSRVACADSGTPRSRVKTGFVSEKQGDDYLASLDKLEVLPIRYLDSKDIPDLEALKLGLTAEIGGKKCIFWVLDHFHICPKPGNMGNDTPGHEALANELTKIARKSCPGLVLAQMTKEALKREDKRPQATDVRYSSLLTNNADIVLGLYRDDMYNKWPEDRMEDPRPAELEIIKSRDGATGYVKLMFVPPRLQWFEREDRKKEEEKEHEF